MCMTLLLSEPMSRAVANGVCRLEWLNFTECVVTYVVTKTRMRFSGVISTAVLRYVEVSSSTRLSIYVPQLCLGLLVMIANGWLLVSLQAGGHHKSNAKSTPMRRHRRTTLISSSRSSPAEKLMFSLTTAHCLHGAIVVYTMTSVVITSTLWTSSSGNTNRPYLNQAGECLATNSFLFVAIFSAFYHHVTLAIDRFHSVRCSTAYRIFWTRRPSAVWVLLGAVWLLGLLVGFLPPIGWRTSFQYCIFFYQYPKNYLLFVGSIYFLGLLVMAVGYGYAVVAKRMPRTGVSFNVEGRSSRDEARMTRTSAILAAICAICFTPLFLHLLLACPQCSARSDNDFVLLGMFALALTDALIFPLVYAFRLKQFEHIAAAICRQLALCKVKRRSASFELKMRRHPRRTRPLNVVVDRCGRRGPLSAHPNAVMAGYLAGELPVVSGSSHGDILY